MLTLLPSLIVLGVEGDFVRWTADWHLAAILAVKLHHFLHLLVLAHLRCA